MPRRAPATSRRRRARAGPVRARTSREGPRPSGAAYSPAMADVAPEGVVRVRANNPSALTLDGTNTYVVARWVVDPGPLMEDHLEAVLGAASDGIEGVVITHDHFDHAQAAPELARRAGG